MDPHRTQPIEIRPGRRSRRKAERRKKLLERLLVSFALTALALVLLFGQSEPPMVEATLPDKPEPTEEPVQGFELGRERVLAPVASGRPVNGAESLAERRSRPGGTPDTQEPPPAIPVPPVPSGTPAGGPAEGPIGPKPTTDDVDPVVNSQQGSGRAAPPPVTTSPPVAVDEEKLTRPPIDLPVDPVDESEEQVVVEQPEETGATPERDLAEEQPEETVNDDAGGGVVKGPGSILEKGRK